MSREKKFDAVKYKNDFTRENYDRISICVRKGMKDTLKEYSERNGYTSINGLVNELLYKWLDEVGYSQKE